MKAVIFAAGKSTRTHPLTLTRPKPLLPIANKPILEHQIEALKGIVDGIVLIVGYKQEMLRDHFGDSFNEMPIQYVEQKEQRGTGHALLQCAGIVNEPFIAHNGDDLYAREDLERLAQHDQAALAKTVEDPRLYGIFEVGENNRVVRLVEKPKEVFSNLANIGAYKFTPAIFDILRDTPPSERGEIEITSAIQTIARQSEFTVVEIEGYWHPIGYAWDLLDANAHILDTSLHESHKGRISPAAHLEGIVSVGYGTIIRPGVVIEGPVVIGENCEIGPNCYIRPGTSIGNHCKVGQGTELKNTILMNNAKVPHLSYVGDSVIGEGANLGCGTVTANFRHDGGNHRSMINGKLISTGRRKLGAIIGDHVHTGIHTSIYPGRRLWPHTTTLPGTIVDRDIESTD